MSWQTAGGIDEARNYTINMSGVTRTTVKRPPRLCPACKTNNLASRNFEDLPVCLQCFETLSVQQIHDILEAEADNRPYHMWSEGFCDYCQRDRQNTPRRAAVALQVTREPWGGDLACQDCINWLIEVEEAKDIIQEADLLGIALRLPDRPRCPCGGSLQSLEPARFGKMRVQCFRCLVTYTATTPDLQTIILTPCED